MAIIVNYVVIILFVATNITGLLVMGCSGADKGRIAMTKYIYFTNTNAGQILRIAAVSLSNNKGLLGDYYRRIRSTAGKQKAVVALARKLAVIYYRMMVTKEQYNPQSLIGYQEKWKDRKIRSLEKYLNKLKEVV